MNLPLYFNSAQANNSNNSQQQTQITQVINNYIVIIQYLQRSMDLKQNDDVADQIYDFEVLPELTQQQAQKLEQEHLERLNKFYTQTKKYSIESWYEALKDFTFQSYPFPLSNIEAYLLSLIYQQKNQQLQWPEIMQAKAELIKKVNTFIKQHFPKGCFFKLSTRSPKDYSWRYQNEQKHAEDVANLIKILKKQQNRPFNADLINDIYRYFLQQSKDKIKIVQGQQFLEVFSKSQRIQIDINDLLYLNHRVAKQLDQRNFSRANGTLLNVWGRKWVDCEWMEEFRCFFNDYQINAITQYDQRCYFSQLQSRQGQIKMSILEYFEEMRPKLKSIQLGSGVMDIIVKFTAEKKSVQLIQINVFNHNSRGSLFSWDKDEKILKQGPLQLRFHKQPIIITKWELLKMMGMIERGIQKIVDSLMKSMGYQQEWKEYS